MKFWILKTHNVLCIFVQQHSTVQYILYNQHSFIYTLTLSVSARTLCFLSYVGYHICYYCHTHTPHNNFFNLSILRGVCVYLCFIQSIKYNNVIPKNIKHFVVVICSVAACWILHTENMKIPYTVYLIILYIILYNLHR